MRLWQIILLSLACGGTAGVAMTWFELGRVVESFQSVSQEKATKAPTTGSASPITTQGNPRAIVEGGNKYTFERMAYGTTDHRTFVVQNQGDRELTLEFDHPSCGKCIETTFTKATVPPGSKCEVVVTYHAHKEGPQFEEAAFLRTNDPLMPELRLAVAGVITKPIRLIPPNLAFGSIPASDGAAATIYVLGYHFGEISLDGHKFNTPSMNESFDVSVKPLAKEAVKEKDEHATCGLEVAITAKTGLPLGPINENMVLKVKAEAEHNIDLSITGEVVGDITVIGKNYAADRGILSLGLIKKGEGKTGSLFLLVKGPYRKDVKFSIGETTPAETLKVQIGEGAPIAEGKAIRVPVTIEVPKSAPVQTHMGDARGQMGKINIETTHPTVKQIPIQVRFVVE